MKMANTITQPQERPKGYYDYLKKVIFITTISGGGNFVIDRKMPMTFLAWETRANMFISVR